MRGNRVNKAINSFNTHEVMEANMENDRSNAFQIYNSFADEESDMEQSEPAPLIEQVGTNSWFPSLLKNGTTP